jgi:hypothetical protein
MKSKDEVFLHLQPQDGDGQQESICLAACGCALHRDYRDTGDPAFVMCAGHQHAYRLLFTPGGARLAARVAAEVLFGRAESLLADEGVDEGVCQEVAREIVAAIANRLHVKARRGRPRRCRCGKEARVDKEHPTDEEGDESDRSSAVARPRLRQLPRKRRLGHPTTG